MASLRAWFVLICLTLGGAHETNPFYHPIDVDVA